LAQATLEQSLTERNKEEDVTWVNFLEEAAINSPTDYETTVEWNKKKPPACQAG
jgi:hypothetical protein